MTEKMNGVDRIDILSEQIGLWEELKEGNLANIRIYEKVIEHLKQENNLIDGLIEDCEIKLTEEINRKKNGDNDN